MADASSDRTAQVPEASPSAGRIAVTGSTGLMGSVLVPELRSRGYEVVRLVRPGAPASSDAIQWDPATGAIDAAALAGIEGVVHLAGEPISERWTADRKRRIRDSRVLGTRLIAGTMAALDPRPRTLVASAAMGIYGSRGDELLDEASGRGKGFLAMVSQEWEDASRLASDAGIRVVQLRFGLVLSPEGGALEKLLTPFRLGAGGKVGSGQQWISWISRTDAIRAIIFALENNGVVGPLNAAAPEPQRNVDFAHSLGHVISRPSFATVPAMAVRLMLGAEMANETVLASQRLVSSRLESTGFTFRHPALESALRHELGKEDA